MGRPLKQPQDKRDRVIGVRLTADESVKLTELRRREPDLPSESEAIRRCIQKEFKRLGLT